MREDKCVVLNTGRCISMTVYSTKIKLAKSNLNDTQIINIKFF